MVEAREMLIVICFWSRRAGITRKQVEWKNGADSEEVVYRIEEKEGAKNLVGSRESVSHHTFIVVGIAAHDRCTTRGTGA